MNIADIKRLQGKLAVRVDGSFGKNTYRALFARFGAGPARAGELGMAAAIHVPRYGIDDTPLRLAHFMAQLSHESGGFHFMEELASGSAYEMRADLGNVMVGDGIRYKGRGPIQLTGRANYQAFGDAAGFNFVDHPEIVAIPSFGLLVACMFWSRKDLNGLADDDRLEAITRKINGGTNGLDQRRMYLDRAKGLLL